MKYTAPFLCLAAVVLAMAGLPLLAQSPYIANAGTKFPVVAAPSVVAPSIDSDGSVEILILGRGNNLRRGYLYYTGDRLTTSKQHGGVSYFFPDDDHPYFYLTNNWYEY